MSIFISLGIYSQKGADGIINGDSDRKAAMEKMVSRVGGKLIDYHILVPTFHHMSQLD